MDILIAFSLIQHTIDEDWDGGGNILGPDPANDPQFADPDADNYRLLAMSPAIDKGSNAHVGCDFYDVDDDGFDCNSNPTQDTPDLDLRDRVVDGNEDPNADVDMGPYEFVPCPWDIAPVGGDCVVGVLDLLELLATWGACADCGDCPADFDDNCDVAVADLLDLLANWGICSCSDGTQPLTLEEELADACLDMDDWDAFEDVMADPNASQAQKDNYLCWMTHYLEDCSKCFCTGGSGCPGPDPFN